MDKLLAYSTLFATVGLAISRPKVLLQPREMRISPGAAAVGGVAVLLLTGLLRFSDLLESARIQWRPLLTLTCVMVMTGVVKELGTFHRLAMMLESHARTASTSRIFNLVFVASLVTPSLLNNDAAILLLTPVVLEVARRLYPTRPRLVEAFAFAVFLAPGVAPFVISNPMNMIVAEFAGIGFNAYAAIMAPISVAGALLTFLILRAYYRRELLATPASGAQVVVPPAHPAERPAFALLAAAFLAYPLTAALGAPIWPIAAVAAAGVVLVARRYRVASPRALLGNVSPDILLFLWAVFLVVVAVRKVGVVDSLTHIYASQGGHPAAQLGVIGVTSALGSAIVDNHPMALLNMMALSHSLGDSRALLAALIGGDIGPRLLPIGSLAGLLWMDLLRRRGIEMSIGRFVRLGTLVLIPTLALSLWLLAMR